MEDPLLNPIQPSSRIGDAAASATTPAADDLGPFPPPPPGFETDPFYAFRDDLARVLNGALSRVQSLKALKSSDEVAAEIASLRKILLPSLKESVAHLERLVVHVEKRRTEFSHLPSEEVTWRRSFLDNVKSKVTKMESDILSAETEANRAVEEERRQQRLARAAKASALKSAETTTQQDKPRTGVFDSSAMRYNQEHMLKTQDENLEEISGSLGRLHSMGNDMYHEIESQNRLLDEVHGDAEGLTGKMDGALNRLDKFLHAGSRGKTVSILFLLMVLLVEILILAVM